MKGTWGPQRLIYSSYDGNSERRVAAPERDVLMAFLIVPLLGVQVEFRPPSTQHTPDTFLMPHKAKGYRNAWSKLGGH